MLSSLLMFACLGCIVPPEDNVCEQAGSLLHDCGVSLPYLNDGEACVGARVNLAECVLENAQDCVDVSNLHEHYEECLTDYVDEADSIPDTVPYVDLGQDTGDLPAEDTDDLCSDGLDNDGDGEADCGDADCVDSEVVQICDQ